MPPTTGITIAELIVALGGLAGLGGLITALATAKQGARKIELEVLKVTIETQGAQLQEYCERTERLQAQVDQLRARVVELETENAFLKAENKKLRDEYAAAKRERGW